MELSFYYKLQLKGTPTYTVLLTSETASSCFQASRLISSHTSLRTTFLEGEKSSAPNVRNCTARRTDPTFQGRPSTPQSHSSNSGTVPGTADLRETRRAWASPQAEAVTTPDHPAPERPVKTHSTDQPVPGISGGANRPYPQAFSPLLESQVSQPEGPP